MKVSKEVRVGFVAIVAIALLVWGYNYLKGTNLLFKTKTVYTEYPSIGGLVKSSPVLVNGFQVGIVNEIYFNPDQTGNIIVEITITDQDIKIPNNSIANLISLDLLSSKAIGLSLGDSSVELEAGDTIPSYFAPSMLEGVTEQILPIKEKAENLMLSMDTAIISFNKTIISINQIFDDRNRRNLSLALANLKTAVESFDILAKNMNVTINSSLKPTLKTYKNLGDSLAMLDMQATLTKARNTLDSLSLTLHKMNSGEGTMGQLMTNDSLYKNLEAVSKDMDLLLIEFREHPKRFVHFSLFGRKEKTKKD
ncbi:MAG: MCE family protein [Vicingus serpentipes]|nr:MCE family protein [Vicingus serpentipes]